MRLRDERIISPRTNSALRNAGGIHDSSGGGRIASATCTGRCVGAFVAFGLSARRVRCSDSCTARPRRGTNFAWSARIFPRLPQTDFPFSAGKLLHSSTGSFTPAAPGGVFICACVYPLSVAPKPIGSRMLARRFMAMCSRRCCNGRTATSVPHGVHVHRSRLRPGTKRRFWLTVTFVRRPFHVVQPNC